MVLLGKGLKGVRRDTLWRAAHHQSSCWQGVHTLQHTTNEQALDEGQWCVVWRLGDVAHTPPLALAYMYLPEGPHWGNSKWHALFTKYTKFCLSTTFVYLVNSACFTVYYLSPTLDFVSQSQTPTQSCIIIGQCLQ